MPSPDKPEDRDTTNPWAAVARYSEIGFIIPAAVVLGYGLGWLLDRWLGTHWIAIVGVIFGAVVGFVHMLRTALRMNSKP